MLYISPSAFFVPSSKPLVELTRLTQNRDGVKVGHKVQHKANHGWADRNGMTIGATYKEENVSTSDENVVREQWERILSEVEAGLWGGILVWRADRLTRQTFEYERCIRVLKKQRAIVCISYDNVTSLDPDGENRIRSMVGQAQLEVANLTARVKANSEERSDGGLYHGGGFRPWCFEGAKRHKTTKRILNSGRIGIKQVEHEVNLANEAARLIAWENWSYRDVIEDWHSRTPPVYSGQGNPWTISNLQRVLTSPRMIGRQLTRTVDPETGAVKVKMKKARWKPVLPRETWDQLRSMVKHQPHKAARIKYLLSPVLECGRCRRGLTGCQRKYRKGGEMVPTPTYRCPSGLDAKAKGSCGKLNVLADPVEKLVVARVFQRLLRTRGFDAGLRQTAAIQDQVNKQNVVVERLIGELAVLDEAQSNSRARMEVSIYIANRRAIVAERDAASAQLQSLQQQLDVPFPVGKDWDNLPDWYETLSPGQQAKLVLAHVRKVTVLPPGRSGRYFKPERVEVLLADAHQVDREGE